jgi:hypothetical protein
MALLGVLLGFFISLAVSGVVIFVSAKLLGEKEGFGTALIAAFSGSIIFALTYYFIGIGWAAALISGVAWLIALGNLYKIGWIKSFIIALFIWVIANLVSLVLPTIAGPL